MEIPVTAIGSNRGTPCTLIKGIFYFTIDKSAKPTTYFLLFHNVVNNLCSKSLLQINVPLSSDLGLVDFRGSGGSIWPHLALSALSALSKEPFPHQVCCKCDQTSFQIASVTRLHFCKLALYLTATQKPHSNNRKIKVEIRAR